MFGTTGRSNLFALCIALALSAGCSGPKESDAPKDASKGDAEQSQASEKKSAGMIGVSVLTLTNPFFLDIANSMKEEAAKFGYEVEAVSGEFNPATQLSQVQDFIVKKADAIVLTPCNSKAVGTAIKAANEAGIPVFTADIASLDKSVKVVTHIATDNYEGGRQAAMAIIEALNGKGKVAIIDFPEVESVLLRTAGFDAYLKEANATGIEVVGKWPGKGSKDPSFASSQEILQAHPDINAIFAINDPSALGAVAAIEKANRAGDIVVVGFDGQPEGKKAILDGKIYADPIQFPKRIGQTTVQTIMKYFNGENVEPEILIPTSLYKKEDAEKDPELKG